MKVKIVKACSVNGKSAKEGETVEVGDTDAQTLMAYGLAVPIEKEKKE